MKLKEEFVRSSKEFVYEMYLSLVYDPKDYEKITRSKMLDAIIEEYSQPGYLYYICTERELQFLKWMKTRKKKPTVSEYEKYQWEIGELNKKCILSNSTYEIFEEQRKNVEDALSYYKKNEQEKRINDQLVIFIISNVKTNVQMLTKALTNLVNSLFNLDDEGINMLLGHPLIHFYCGFYEEYFEFSNNKEEIIFYREYYDFIDDVVELRKQFGIAGSKKCNLLDNLYIFYYGFPLQNKTVKKMYDMVKKEPYDDLIFLIIDEMRVLNDRKNLDKLFPDSRKRKIVNDALDEMPCAVMNGFTPKEYLKQKERELILNLKFDKIPQNNAHLCKKAADQFYKLYFALLEYTNKKYQIVPGLKRIYKQEGLDATQLSSINDYLWQHKNIIDEFICDNEYHFNEEELETINGFKTAITSDHFIVVGFEREYTKILSKDGKIYMVKGIRADFDKIIDPESIPLVIQTTLLMYQGYIIFNSFFSSMNVTFGNDIKGAILNDYNNGIKYYHL